MFWASHGLAPTDFEADADGIWRTTQLSSLLVAK